MAAQNKPFQALQAGCLGEAADVMQLVRKLAKEQKQAQGTYKKSSSTRISVVRSHPKELQLSRDATTLLQPSLLQGMWRPISCFRRSNSGQ